MSLRRELRAAAGLVFGLLGFFLAYVHRGGFLAAPFAVLGAALWQLPDAAPTQGLNSRPAKTGGW